MGAFSSDDLIQLPRLSGGEASLLIAELLAVALCHDPAGRHSSISVRLPSH